ncbi:uncharacterized protein DUF1064 [Acinetobacter calcoaceticus]|uniref:Uncharacterized protein DUF1064 n=1 Tax=Acinetobacter calcoaceticus TaxID=471 RepID=A0A4R1XGL8_ACICA|nr:uncharacterized protein DUF1064 [Acinetobacter calcoaceticus]
MIKPKRSKFNNKKAVLNGTTFDSRKEARRFQELQILEHAGEIRELQTQYAFVLAEPVKFKNEPRRKPALRYFADFVYIKDGCQVVEDVKSVATRTKDTYRIKKHLMMSVHGVEIVEV